MEPAAVSSAAPREETDSRPLPPGWRSYMSPEGQKYYVNSSSKANGSHSRIKPSQPTETANVALRKPVMNKQPPGSVSPAKRQIKEVKETKITGLILRSVGSLTCRNHGSRQSGFCENPTDLREMQQVQFPCHLIIKSGCNKEECSIRFVKMFYMKVIF
eukprot:superscaffoldBa00001783_g11998